MRPLRSLVPAVALSFLGLFASQGCGDGGSGSRPSQGDASAFAAEYCALYEPCCVSAGFKANDQPSCRALFGAAVVQNAQLVQACLDDYKAQAKSPDFCSLTLPTPETCKLAFPQNKPSATGTAAPGAACSSISDCAPSAAGDVSCTTPFEGGGTKSICQVATHAKVGDACVGTVDGTTRIVTGKDGGGTLAYCFRTDGVFCSSGTCRAIVDVGGACTSSDDCSTQYCSSGKCAAKVAAGGSCADTAGACDASTYCDSSSNVCKARVADGGACDTNDQCTSTYCNGGTCGKRPQGGLGLLLYCQ